MPEKKSILFLTNAYPDFDSSYRGHFIKRMANQLQAEGYQITVVTPKIYTNSRHFEEQNGMGVYRFPFFSGNKLLIEHQKIPYLRMLFYYLSGFLMTMYAMLKYHCDLIHVHWVIPTGLIGLVTGIFLRKPYIVTIHGSDFRMAMDRPFLLKLFLYVCKRSQHVTCVSGMQEKEIERLGIKGEKISVYPMCVEEDFLKGGRSRERRCKTGPITIVSNRNLLPIYNVSLLIRAIPIVLQEEPHSKFLIAGDGPERVSLEKEVKKLNANSSVRFLGRVPHEEMPNLLTQADIYVSTSLYDGTSVSLLEAMATGTFPIVTDIPSNQEWIHDGKNGFLVSSENQLLLARKIIEAIHSQELLAEASEENIRIVEEKAYWMKHIQRTSAIYEKAASLTRSAASSVLRDHA
jgi:glycosyltransferase involved in cell wall biosynthesis